MIVEGGATQKLRMVPICVTLLAPFVALFFNRVKSFTRLHLSLPLSLSVCPAIIVSQAHVSQAHQQNLRKVFTTPNMLYKGHGEILSMPVP